MAKPPSRLHLAHRHCLTGDIEDEPHEVPQFIRERTTEIAVLSSTKLGIGGALAQGAGGGAGGDAGAGGGAGRMM